jgi:hypothetical protein
MKRIHIRKPSPGLAIALLALFAALSGTAYAANVVPLAKRAYSADNAAKLQGKTLAQVLASLPKPNVKSAQGLIVSKTLAISAPAERQWSGGAPCDSGMTPINAGYQTNGPDSRLIASFPILGTSEGSGWWMVVQNMGPQPVTGTMTIICVK